MRKIILALALAAPMFASAGVTELVINGGFEANIQNASTWNIYSNLIGWTGGTGGIELRNNVAGAAFQGSNNYVELDTTGNSSISQNINTALNQHYTLNFAYSPRAGVSSASNGIEVLWNGAAVGSFTGNGAGASGNVWATKTLDLIGNGSTSSLTFRAIGTSDSLGGSLDAVSLTSAVPEPETYSMMLAGLGALGLMARRRRKA